jgi:hypothetical protein
MTITETQRRQLKMEACAALYRDGRISRAECFKHEVAVATEKDAGPIILLTDALTNTIESMK